MQMLCLGYADVMHTLYLSYTFQSLLMHVSGRMYYILPLLYAFGFLQYCC